MSTATAGRIRYVITDDTDGHVIDTAATRDEAANRSEWRKGATAYAYRVVSPRNVEQAGLPETPRAVYTVTMRGVFVGYAHAVDILAGRAIARGHFGPVAEVSAS